MRHRPVRRLHRAHERGPRKGVPDAHVRREVRQDYDHRGPLPRREPSAAEGVVRARRRPVWLLPARPDHVGRGAALLQSQPQRRRHRRRDGRQHLQVRHLPQDPRGDPPGGGARGRQGGQDMSAAPEIQVDRRSFLKLAALAGGGLILGHYTRAAGGPDIAEPDVGKVDGLFIPNAFIRIAPDGAVTVYSARPEVGQGIRTSLPMGVAEELGADWRSVSVASAPLDPAFGPQSAGGSTSTPTSYMQMRRMGAAARMMLVEAAAQTWGVPADECVAADGAVRHAPSGRILKFGDLVAKASTLAVPDEQTVRLKDPKDFTLLGSRVGGVDNAKVVTGQPLFGIDQKRPGMAFAVYEKAPVWGARPLGANLG